MQAILDRMILGNTLRAWLTAVVVCTATLLVVWVVRSVVLARLRRIASQTSTRWDDLAVELLADLRVWCVLAVTAAIGSRPLSFPEGVHNGVRYFAVIVVALQALLSSRLLLNFLIEQILNKAKRADGTPDPSVASATTIIRFMGMLVLGSLLVLLTLANLNVEITPLITGLGIGGIAIALAAQSILGDLFASLSILFDKPFLVGHFIVVGDLSGTVEKIGVKSTQVRALSGELIIFRNTDLLGSRVRNFFFLKERRAVFKVGVVYETPPAKLRDVARIIREAVESQALARLDRAHFASLGAYSLDFECVYFVLAPDYKVYMDVQQAINLTLIERFAAEGISFAYPTAVEIQRRETPAARA